MVPLIIRDALKGEVGSVFSCITFCVIDVTLKYVMLCAIWYQSLFGVCMVVRAHANAFFYLYVVSVSLHELAWHSNGSIKCQMLERQSNDV